MSYPIISLDVEGTGLDTAKDRIVSLAMACYSTFPTPGAVPDDGVELFFNPGCEMTKEVIDIHGITNEMVANQPPFKAHAGEISQILESAEVLIGYNLWRYDLPIIHEELCRAGYAWNWTRHAIVDAGNLFKIKEPRDLSAASLFYRGTPHVDAHSAWADSCATADILAHQIRRYTDLHTLSYAELMKATKLDDNVDLAGKIVMKNGVPCWNFGKSKGQPCASDRGFGFWILKNDFPTDTKLAVQKILDETREEDSFQ